MYGMARIGKMWVRSRDHRVLRARKEKLERLVLKVLRDHRVQQGRKVLRDHRALQVSKVLKESRVCRDCEEKEAMMV